MTISPADEASAQRFVSTALTALNGATCDPLVLIVAFLSLAGELAKKEIAARQELQPVLAVCFADVAETIGQLTALPTGSRAKVNAH